MNRAMSSSPMIRRAPPGCNGCFATRTFYDLGNQSAETISGAARLFRQDGFGLYFRRSGADMKTNVLVVLACSFLISCAAYAQDQQPQSKSWSGKVTLSRPGAASETSVNSQPLALQLSLQYRASSVLTAQAEPMILANNSPCLAMRTYVFKREAGSADETHLRRERTCTPAQKFKLVPAK